MNTQEIIETLEHSFEYYYNFLITYNDMIDNISDNIASLPRKQQEEFLIEWERIKNKFYGEFGSEYKNLPAGQRELYYIENMRIEKIRTLYEPILKQHFINQRLKKLQLS